jgi:hypothetical protein
MDTLLDHLSARGDAAGGPRFSDTDLARWGGDSEEDIAKFFDKIGREIALAYHSGQVSFSFCDLLVNDLFALVIDRSRNDPQPPWPALFYEVYEAFDAGEWHRRDDKSDDPVEEYTNPAIDGIVAKL